MDQRGIDEIENSGLAVLLTNRLGGEKKMYISKKYAGEKFIGALGGSDEEVLIDNDGYGNFKVKNGSVAVWIMKKFTL